MRNKWRLFTDKYENMAWSLVTEVYSFHQKLSELCSDMTDEMFGVITTVNAERFWRCNQPSQVSQTETSKRRIQSFCLSVFLPPASLSQQHLWASITHSCQRIMCIVTLFLSYNQNTSCTWLWWSIFIVCHCFHDFPVLWTPHLWRSVDGGVGQARAAITVCLHILM